MNKRDLDDLRVGRPCDASWDEMEGDARHRHCAQCERTITDVTTLSDAEAEAMLSARAGQRLCVRGAADEEGRLMTRTRFVSWLRGHIRRVSPAAAALSVMVQPGSCAPEPDLSESPVLIPPAPPEEQTDRDARLDVELELFDREALMILGYVEE